MFSCALSGVSALVPDLDSPRSKLGRDIAPVSWTAGKIFGHRGVTHSLLGAAVAGFMFSVLTHYVNPAWLVWLPWKKMIFQNLTVLFLAGYLSHLVADCLTREGCPLFWPIKKRFKIPLMRTGSPVGEGIASIGAVIFILSFLSGRVRL